MKEQSFYVYKGITFCCSSIEEAEEMYNWQPDPQIEEQIALEEKKTEYQRLRKSEYPSLEEQEDMKYWDAINGTSIWIDTITSIKEKYPKPE